MIAAIGFGAIALFLIARLFFGSSGSSSTANTNARPRTTPRTTTQNTAPAADNADAVDAALVAPQPVVFERTPLGDASPGRNIFAFYVRPVAAASPTTATNAVTPTPAPATPTPTPPVVLAGLSRPSVYAGTGEFPLQVSGDKFTPDTRIYLDGQELPTKFVNPQQLTTSVPSALINAPGMRSVMVRTPDNQLYSNTATINVMQPPKPTVTYVGYIKRQRRNNETAILKTTKNDLLNAQVNDIVEGRFRVASISERAVELVDKDLNIRHTLTYVDNRSPSTASGARPINPPPPPRTDDDDDEP